MSRNQLIIVAILGLMVAMVLGSLGALALLYLTEGFATEPSAPVQPVATPTRHPTSTPTRVRATPTPRPPQHKLALVSMRGSPSYGYFIVEGQVKNISGSSLDNVVAVVTVYDGNHRFITYDEALIDYTPILAGQTSPFSVYVDYNPAIEWYDVEFKYLLGGTIPWRDDM